MPRTQFTVRALLEAMLAAWLLIAVPATMFAGAFAAIFHTLTGFWW